MKTRVFSCAMAHPPRNPGRGRRVTVAPMPI